MTSNRYSETGSNFVVPEHLAPWNSANTSKRLYRSEAGNFKGKSLMIEASVKLPSIVRIDRETTSSPLVR